jgi:hypothetical protein
VKRPASATADFLAEHYVYEIKMLRTAYQLLSHAKEQGRANALIEVFVLHARVLIDFFDSTPRRDDAVAGHFTRTGTFTATATKSIRRSLRKRISKQIVHLTYSRVGANKIDGSDRLTLLHALEADHAEFSRQVAPEFVGCFRNEQPFGLVVSAIKPEPAVSGK